MMTNNNFEIDEGLQRQIDAVELIGKRDGKDDPNYLLLRQHLDQQLETAKEASLSVSKLNNLVSNLKKDDPDTQNNGASTTMGAKMLSFIYNAATSCCPVNANRATNVPKKNA